MTRLSGSFWKLLPLACGLLLLGDLTLVLAQAKRAGAARPARQQQPKNPPFHFGDITISNFDVLSGELGGKIVEARGANTTVDAVDARLKARSQLKASRITAHMSETEEKKNTVERVEAVGNVRYSDTRPSPVGEGQQAIRGVGSKAIYYKREGRITLDGPVTFYAERPTPDGKQTQSIEGRADQAHWEMEKQILTLSGSVEATVTMPDQFEQPAKLAHDTVILNVGARPLLFELKRGKITLYPRQPEKTEKKTE